MLFHCRPFFLGADIFLVCFYGCHIPICNWRNRSFLWSAIFAYANSFLDRNIPLQCKSCKIQVEYIRFLWLPSGHSKERDTLSFLPVFNIYMPTVVCVFPVWDSLIYEISPRYIWGYGRRWNMGTDVNDIECFCGDRLLLLTENHSKALFCPNYYQYHASFRWCNLFTVRQQKFHHFIVLAVFLLYADVWTL